MDMRAAINLIESTQKLDELQGIKQHTAQDFYSKTEVLDYMREQGFEVLNWGMYGGVCDHPSFKGRYVLKVFADPFYEFFLDWASKQPENPHLPSIIGRVSKLTGEGRMVRIERLSEMTRAAYGAARLGRYVTYLRDPKKMAPEEAERTAAFLDQKGLGTLRESLDTIAEIKPAGAYIDLTPENFMLRGDTIVISDPYGGARIPFLR